MKPLVGELIVGRLAGRTSRPGKSVVRLDVSMTWSWGVVVSTVGGRVNDGKLVCGRTGRVNGWTVRAGGQTWRVDDGKLNWGWNGRVDDGKLVNKPGRNVSMAISWSVDAQERNGEAVAEMVATWRYT